MDEPNGATMCSIACMDADFDERRSDIYPESTNLTDCHPFWSGQRVPIEMVDYDTDFMRGIQKYAWIMVMGSFVYSN